MRTCSACATTTDDSGRFCPACGAVFAASEAAATAQLAEPNATLVGKTIDGFVFESVIGTGSFGRVYRGRQAGLDRVVAIKVPSFEIVSDPTMAKRFAREARSAARIVHPGVVGIYAVGELPDGRPYLVMQFIDGQPLEKILEAGPLAPLRTLKIARDVASALADTHAAAVIHRDLKPANIMWPHDRHGDDRVTIVDFGIAVAKPGNADATRLTTNGLIGTPHYMSPEQAQGEAADHRSDLYALGCIIFELVTGETPFAGSGFEVLLAHMGRPAPTPSDINPDVPAAVDRVVRRLLQKRADDRPSTADEVVTLLDEAIAELTVGVSAGASAVKTTRAKRQTAAPTKRDIALDRTAAVNTLDLDAAPPPVATAVAPRRRTALWAGLAVVGALGTGALGYQLAPRASALAAPEDTDKPASAEIIGRRTVVSDDGEMTQRTTLYDPILAGVRVQTVFELWNAMGAPVEAAQLVVTLEGPDGTATGLTARPSRTTKGRFTFNHVFPAPGAYVLRVFPPEAHSVFTLDLKVEGR